jgi:diketogulonate reductase-like aldo/keto reductase
MEKVQVEGKAKSIGVSNYLKHHIETTLAIATIQPVVNQVEFHPYLQRQGHLQFYKSKGITLEACGPLTAIRKAMPGPCDGLYTSLAKKYGISEESIALRYGVSIRES